MNEEGQREGRESPEGKAQGGRCAGCRGTAERPGAGDRKSSQGSNHALEGVRPLSWCLLILQSIGERQEIMRVPS